MAVRVFDGMLGKVFNKVHSDGEVLVFLGEDGEHRFEHIQDCCEHVYIESIDGDLSDLVGTPLLMAEQVDSDRGPLPKDYAPESYTWTFYKFATIKGSVTVRFYGTSNGYYSEGVTYFAPGSDHWGNV